MNPSTVQLRQRVVELKTGPFGSALSADEYADEGVPLVNPSDLQGGRINSDGAVKVPELVAQRLAAYRVMPGDLIVARRGELGRYGLVHAVDTGSLCGTGSLLVRPAPGLCARYLGYLLETSHVRDWLSLHSVGSTMDNLSERILGRLPVPDVDKESQERVANFLDEQTARIDALIEEKALLLERLQEFRWSQVAHEILLAPPPGSQMRRLKHLVLSCQNGLWGEEPKGDGHDLVVVRVADFDKANRRVDLANPTRRFVEPNKASDRLLAPGDLLIEKSGGGPTTPVGNVVMFKGSEPAICSNFVGRMPVTPGNSPDFVCLLFQALYALGRNIPHIKQTSGIQNLDAESYLSQAVPIPSLTDQRALVARIERGLLAIESLEASARDAIATLREYRSSLISAAVTGQVDLSTYEAKLQEAA